MVKYCKLTGWRMGQLISNLAGQLDIFYITDKKLELRFNKLWLETNPKRDRGGYYPHGHKINEKRSNS